MARRLAGLLGALALAAASSARAAPRAPPAATPPSYVFDLATAGGLSESTWATIAYDRGHDELFATYGGQVHLFNRAGMEYYAFGGDGDVGSVERVAPLESGDVLLLSRMMDQRVLLRCDFRGEKLGPFELKKLPPAFSGFAPDLVQALAGKVFLVETTAMRVVVADEQGEVLRTLELAPLVTKYDSALKLGMGGFWADAQGRFFFTLPLSFTAFELSPGGELRQFGARGSSPGKFNIVGAIATDERGTVFVLDRLRSVVLVFDRNLTFLLEFGYRGDGPENLIAPYGLAVGNGKLFVSQARERGVKVFQYPLPPAPPPPVSAVTM
ncbi:NHL repeat-containing protein [Anaeromyxobacter paludicola]|uniref:NHL repeat containing protein n=1 Tax=Anaeromyxobacter paludicola TaxID=2918171 RepID=A0ABM7XBI1_9BACT|nr:hypothetical protein [Anaeromyxobacter paludicola]BDG09216.1 hypothetical protein AMPC_23290 [Anaeromyxobacter paludicola]